MRYSAASDPLVELRGRRVKKGRGKGREGGWGRREGEDPQCLKCVDAKAGMCK